MNATTISVETWTTEGGKKLHLIACPHLAGKDDVRRATQDEVDSRSLCVLCEKDAAGHGRIHCASLDEAFSTFGLAPAYRGDVRLLAEHTEHDAVWVVNSGSYIALGLRGQTVLGINKTYLRFRDGTLVTFDGYRPGSGGGSPRPEDRLGETCQHCYVTKPLSGRCDTCD